MSKKLRKTSKRAYTNTRQSSKECVQTLAQTNAAKEYIQTLRQTRKRAHTDIKGIKHEIHIGTKTNKPKSTDKLHKT